LGSLTSRILSHHVIPSEKMLGMCYILCMIVGPPIMGLEGEPLISFGGRVIHQNFGGILPLVGAVFQLWQCSGTWHSNPWFSIYG
jgi:hypothetical protein